jgi:hypothetical protein
MTDYWTSITQARTTRGRILAGLAGTGVAGADREETSSKNLLSRRVDTSSRAVKGGISTTTTAVSNFGPTRGARENVQTALVYDHHEARAIGGGGSDYPDIDGNLQVNFKSGEDCTGHLDADGKPDAYDQKRIALPHEFQRRFASKMYVLHQPSLALSYQLAQPYAGNRRVFASMNQGSEMNEAGVHPWYDASKKAWADEAVAADRRPE